MKKAILFVLCAGFMNTAFAKDSSWNLCVGDVVLYEETVSLVVNVYEHRNGEGRSTDLTMIYGGNVLAGGFNSTESDSGIVALKNTNSLYRGSAAYDYNANTLALKGKLSLFGEATPLIATLNCTSLGN